MLLINILVLALTFGDFLALHDIKNDYVSSNVLDEFDINMTSLPQWTTTEGEWDLVTISFVARLLFLLVNIPLIWMVSLKLNLNNGPETSLQSK